MGFDIQLVYVNEGVSGGILEQVELRFAPFMGLTLNFPTFQASVSNVEWNQEKNCFIILCTDSEFKRKPESEFAKQFR